MVVPGASCFICLEEGSDESGNPLVRDCSCRGDAGFAHLSCLVKYAERKSTLAANDPTPATFVVRWRDCPNCTQSYKGQLSLDISSAFVSFVETVYPRNSTDDAIKVMTALKVKIKSLTL